MINTGAKNVAGVYTHTYVEKPDGPWGKHIAQAPIDQKRPFRPEY